MLLFSSCPVPKPSHVQGAARPRRYGDVTQVFAWRVSFGIALPMEALIRTSICGMAGRQPRLPGRRCPSQSMWGHMFCVLQVAPGLPFYCIIFSLSCLPQLAAFWFVISQACGFSAYVGFPRSFSQRSCRGPLLSAPYVYVCRLRTPQPARNHPASKVITCRYRLKPSSTKAKANYALRVGPMNRNNTSTSLPERFIEVYSQKALQSTKARTISGGSICQGHRAQLCG